ncbi:MAG: hypothetical protein J6Y45_03470 [Bacteroidales bacterium]|nr:hypothetical protein [Bacteroidales bacterium]
MKKIIALSAIALALLACNKEIAEQQIAPSKEGLVTITATTEDLSKVVLDMNAETNLVWADTDAIAVYDGSSANTFTIKSNSGASAVFEGSCDTAAPMLYAVYPAAAYSAPATDAIKVEIPASQTIPDGGCVDPEALVAVGYAVPGQPMAFKQVCALLKLTVTGSDIMEIVIKGKGLAGTAAINADGTINASGASLTDEIVLHPASGMFAPGGYFVAVAPGTTPAGTFSINYNTVSATATKTASSEVRFERAKGLDAGPLTGFTKTVIITTMAELFNWNASRSTADIEDVKIGADIDMEGEPWVPKDFTGTFDGQGHKLFNLNVNRTSNACFFNTVKGTVKDVTFGTSTDSSFIIQNNPDDDGSAWRYAGLITRLSEGAVLEKVTSYVPVSVASESKSKTRVGGLVAIVAGDATIKNCVNNGKVTIEATAPAAAGAVGGVVGWTDAVLTAQNVTNNGDITVFNASTSYIGGILSTDGIGGTFSNCSNTGHINVPVGGNRAMCIGGILGDASNSTVDGCSNSGSIISICDGELKVGGIVGRAYIGCSISNCSNAASGQIYFNPETFEKQAFVGGIVGNAPAGNTGTLSITKCVNYAYLNSTHRNVAVMGGIAGFLNMSGGTVVIEDSDNFGDVSRTVDVTTAGVNNNVCVAGIVAAMAGLEGSRIARCNNHGDLYTNTNSGSATTRIGGISAWVQSYTEIVDCSNDSKVIYAMGDDATAVGSTIHQGGIVGHLVKGSSIKNCQNSGVISSDRKQVNRVGGIVGTCNSSAIYNSLNLGAVEVLVPESVEVKYWQGIGGIVGFAEGTTGGCTRAIEDCTNRGDIKVSINAVPNYDGRFCVGGIIGEPYSAYPISGCKNYGSVSGTNTNATKPSCYVGGVMGFDADATASTLSNNANYGAITNQAADASYSAAGGLYGKIGKATGATGYNFGSVSGLGAGAVAGVNSVALTATLCDAVTVNGVAKASASDEGVWLCPSNTGTITPTYVAHSSSE